MLYRSTGLGKSEIIAEIVGIKRQGDYVVMELQTTEPVRWKIRGALNRQDFITVIKAILKWSVLSFFLNPVLWFKKSRHPGEF